MMMKIKKDKENNNETAEEINSQSERKIKKEWS